MDLQGIAMHPFRTVAACALAAALTVSAPAHAGHGQPGADHARSAPADGPAVPPPGGLEHRPVWKEGRHPGYAMDPAASDAWLADCRSRVAARGFAGERDHCAAYLDSYYAQYAGYGYAGYAPTVMVPVSKPGECTETVVTEEADAPVIRRAVPRRAPAVRDKRVRVQ